MVQFRRATRTRDFLPEEMEKRKFVEDIIRNTFESYGFQQLQTPIIEEFALVSARSSEEIREKMFTFICEDVEYALRPELTASVCRLVSSEEFSRERMTKPYKFYYIGQCYRYERQQTGRYREFWQAGVELIGSSSPMADAEVIAVAIRVLEKLGISVYHLKVGNIGIFREILAAEGRNFDFQCKIIEDLSKIKDINEKCREMQEKKKLNRDDFDYVKTTINDLYSIQEEIQYEGDYEIIPEKEFSEENISKWLISLPLYAEATYRTVFTKIDNIPRSLADLLLKVLRVEGEKKDVINVASELLHKTPAKNAFKALLDVLKWLEFFGVENYDVVLGVVRGFEFYTDTVFEIDCPLLEVQKQICGGGRYDNLVYEFGGPQLPATGFAFWFDRVVDVFKKISLRTLTRKNRIFVATTSPELRYKAIEIAEKLRKEGKKIEIDVMERNFRLQLSYATKKNYDYCVIVAPKELEEECVILKDMKTKKQRIVEIKNLIKEI